MANCSRQFFKGFVVALRGGGEGRAIGKKKNLWPLVPISCTIFPDFFLSLSVCCVCVCVHIHCWVEVAVAVTTNPIQAIFKIANRSTRMGGQIFHLEREKLQQILVMLAKKRRERDNNSSNIFASSGLKFLLSIVKASPSLFLTRRTGIIYQTAK